jgi:uncharacterized protein (DUF3820 family)
MAVHTTATTVTDATPIPFGKYKGKAMANVPAIYLLWLYDNGCSHEGVKRYIINNLDGLRKEAANVKR